MKTSEYQPAFFIHCSAGVTDSASLIRQTAVQAAISFYSTVSYHDAPVFLWAWCGSAKRTGFYAFFHYFTSCARLKSFSVIHAQRTHRIRWIAAPWASSAGFSQPAGFWREEAGKM